MNVDENELCMFHCTIHQQKCAKPIKLTHVISKIVGCINLIKSITHNYRQFNKFIEDIEAQYGNLIYFCEVRWLSKGKMSKRLYDLRNGIFTFLEIKVRNCQTGLVI
jgi:hypothetical protein